jgi:hypothetical protein
VKRRHVKRIVILSLLSPKQFTQKKEKRWEPHEDGRVAAGVAQAAINSLRDHPFFFR